MAKALIVSGGWEGHSPFDVADQLGGWLESDGFEVEQSRELRDFEKAGEFDLVIPNWTMGEISYDQVKPLLDAVESGVGIAGIHGGMGDAFRSCTEYQFMVGGQFVAHPGVGDRRYTVEMIGGFDLTEGIGDFEVATEKYYLHIDPAIRVLATTKFEDYDDTAMPVAWTKNWGLGRVFYCSLGHEPEILQIPEVQALVRRGMRWAADRASELQGATMKEVYGNA